jgi:hypothetical protein
MQFLQCDIECRHGRRRQIGEQGGAIGVKQPIQRTSCRIIAHLRHRWLIESERRWGKSTDGFGLAILGLAFDRHRAQHHTLCQ